MCSEGGDQLVLSFITRNAAFRGNIRHYVPELVLRGSRFRSGRAVYKVSVGNTK